ncbi:MAG: tetratricopeptide repeat protein, partial [Terriglobales bacterium]
MRWSRGAVYAFAFVCAAGVCLASDAPLAPGQAQTPAPPLNATPAACTGDASPAGCSAASPGVSLPSSPAAVFVPPSRNERKAAHRAFERGLKLQQSNDLEAAFPEFEEAARLSPQNTEYLAAREMTRENLASTHLDRGNLNMLQGHKAEALAEFRAALELDPQNEFAQQRVHDAAGPANNSAPPVKVVEQRDSLAARPIERLADFHYVGDARGLLVTIATAYGLSITFDDTFPTRNVHFDLNQADFATAIHAASLATRTFTVAVGDTALFAA